MENHGISSLAEHVASGSGISNPPGTRFVHYIIDLSPGFGSNALGTAKTDQRHKGLGGKTDGWWRKVGAAKAKLGIGEECDKIKVKKDHMNVKVYDGERARVQNMLELFRKKFEEMTEARDESEKGRIDLKAMNDLTNERIIIKNSCSVIGPVPGVEVGDIFHYRVELVIVGLHKHYERGIDTTEWGFKRLATCIVANEEHSDNMNDPNILTYIGEGGKSRAKEGEKPSDQELKGGNLALWENKISNSPVRVVKGFKVDRFCRRRGRMVKRTEYVYDGVYEVKSLEKKLGPLKNWIFEFQLFRCPGQPAVSLISCKRMNFQGL